MVACYSITNAAENCESYALHVTRILLQASVSIFGRLAPFSSQQAFPLSR
jgi:hypothetical protein